MLGKWPEHRDAPCLHPRGNNVWVRIPEDPLELASEDQDRITLALSTAGCLSLSEDEGCLLH